MKRLVISLIALLNCAAFDWSDVKTPAPGPTQSIGFYSAGCIQGARPLPFDGVGYEAIRISRNRYWGQPVTLQFIETLGARMHAAGQAPLLIGDIGQPRGGPAPTGHASHQDGLDADIWFERQAGPRLAPTEREHPRLRSLVRDDMSIDDGVFGPQHVQLLKVAAEMPHLDRLFVNRWIKARLCHTVTGDRSWLRKLVPWYGHDAHFHVRLYCPPGNPQCQPQADYARDDGCGAALDWWLQQPPVVFPADDVPPTKPYRPKLPAACAAILHAPSQDLPVTMTGK
ncbi:penicillin-insensitive murein endopeptidase [Reyranella sp.]|jgi:penicillin-insensitive murein endopeptidase|uniref:penicillin-insensitive murein endopeptidase n=1 Tax=Reyranella sp. TaxID=1929291 RepID=UPI002F931D63